MRNAGFALVFFVIMVLSGALIMTEWNKATRENEMANALDTAIENTVDNLKVDKSYIAGTNDELVADFIQDFLVQVGSDSDVEINVKAVDASKGLLSVDVTMYFKYSNGRTGHVSTERTVIFEHRGAD